MRMFRRLTRSSIRESFDNLPSGVCFFSRNGMLTLCNRAMYRLVFLLTGQDLQTAGDLDGALESPSDRSGVRRDGDSYLFPDGTVWRFSRTGVTGGGRSYTEYLAFDVTALYRAAQTLEEKNRDLREMAARMERITANAVAIMREEELLSMKMRIHNEVGSSVLAARQFFLSGCPDEQKPELLSRWRRTVAQLLGELGDEDETDAFRELSHAAEAIGAGIELTGELPKSPSALRLLTAAMRECLTNAVRHAGGRRIFVRVCVRGTFAEAVITNDGRPPEREITEGGGLSSLRARIESSGGQMRIQSLPAFSLCVTIPMKGDEPIDERADRGR